MLTLSLLIAPYGGSMSTATSLGLTTIDLPTVQYGFSLKPPRFTTQDGAVIMYKIDGLRFSIPIVLVVISTGLAFVLLQKPEE
mgnify:CR=1 FL=1